MILLVPLVLALAIGFVIGGRTASRRADAQRERLFSFIAHELNSHVTGLQLTAGNLLAGAFGALGDEQRRWIEAIEGRTDLLGDLIGDFRDTAHWEFGGDVSLRPEDVDLKDLLEREHARLRAGAGRREVALTLEVGDGLPKARADSYRLKRALSSLLQNALGFSGKGGAVAVSAWAAGDLLTVRMRFRRPADLPAPEGDIFDLRYPALRAEEALRVVGVGLGVAKRSLEESGGTVALEQSQGGDSCFLLTVPAARG